MNTKQAIKAIMSKATYRAFVVVPAKAQRSLVYLWSMSDLERRRGRQAAVSGNHPQPSQPDAM